MFTLYLCKKCGSGYLVSLGDSQTHLLKKVMRCPNHETCKGHIRAQAESNIPVEGAVKISAVQLYQASMGVGLPRERKCTPKDVRKAVLGSRVTDIRLEPAGDQKRSIVYSLSFDNGKVIHLAASTKGATIFKMTEVKNGR